MADAVYTQLREQIILVQRFPGDILNEACLAEEFQVSKTPVREALQLLSRTGWIVTLPRKGYVVRPVELRDVRDNFTIRRLLEPSLAGDAACNITAGQFSGLEEAVARQATAGEDFPAALNAARIFHIRIAEVSKNSRIQTIIADLLDEIRRLHYLLPDVEGHITSAAELRAHNAIISAVRLGDGGLARQLMAEHLNEVAHVLVNSFAGI